MAGQLRDFLASLPTWSHLFGFCLATSAGGSWQLIVLHRDHGVVAAGRPNNPTAINGPEWV